MLDDFIFSFILLLGEEQKIENLQIKDQILKDLINSEEDFNHVKLQFEEYEWIFPLPNQVATNNTVEIVEKSINVKEYL